MTDLKALAQAAKDCHPPTAALAAYALTEGADRG
jgi:hypothetical protein